jgi:hypothetical protein
VGKLYRVVSNESVEKYGVKVGDICTLLEPVAHGVAWFYNESWDDDGIWCFALTKLEEITETN